MEAVNVTLSLSADSAELEPDVAVNDTLAERSQALHTNVLERVLDTSNEVRNELGDATTVEHATADTLGNKELVTLGEVSGGTSVGGLGIVGVGRANTSLLVLHGGNGTHTTVSLDELTLTGNKVLARRLGGTGQQTTHHDSASTESKTLDNVADVLDTTVSNARHAEASGERGDAVDRGGLGTADGHDLLGNAGRAGTHTDTKTVDTGSDQAGGLLASDDVATNDIEVGEGGLDVLDHLDLVHGVTLRRVEDDNVEAGINQLLETALVLGAGTNGSGGDELLGVGQLGGEGIVDVLHQIGAGEKRDEVAVLVNNGELALLGLLENRVGLGEVDAGAGSDQVGGHDDGDRVAVVVVELGVTRGDDTDDL